MSRRGALLSVSCSFAAVALSHAAGAAGQAEITVATHPVAVSAQLGTSFTFETTVANEASASSDELIAHLEILSLEPGVYVDPEDWSEGRTRYLGRLPTGGSRVVRWRIKPIAAGTFAALVTVLPRHAGTAPVAGMPVRFAVQGQGALDAGPVLALAIAIPVLLAVLLVVVWVRRRRGAVTAPEPSPARRPDRAR